jgi:hypothetical protein
VKLKTAGGEIAYDVSGEGPAVLFLHAFPLGLAMIAHLEIDLSEEN